MSEALLERGTHKQKHYFCVSDVFTDRHTAAQIKVYGEVNNE